MIKLSKRLFLKQLSEDFRYIYNRNSDGDVPTPSVVDTAKKALQVLKYYKIKLPHGGNQGSGIQVANKIINREPYTHSQLKRLKSFFDSNYDQYTKEKNSGIDPIKSTIIISWDLHGGDAGKRWVEQSINSTKNRNKTSKKIRRGFDGEGNTKRLMDPTNTRIMREAHIGTNGLEDFYFEDQETTSSSEPIDQGSELMWKCSISIKDNTKEHLNAFKRKCAFEIQKSILSHYDNRVSKFDRPLFDKIISIDNIIKYIRVDVNVFGLVTAFYLKKELIDSYAIFIKD
jgi:hypothetical protein